MIESWIRLSMKLSRPIPPLANWWAWRLFCAPIPGARRDPEFEARITEAERTQVTTRGGQIELWTWRRTQSGTRPLVLLVHGWQGSGASWKTWIEPCLDAGFDVMTFDAPGHGRNRPRFANLPIFADAVAKVTSAARPDAMIGHSLGGMAVAFSMTGTAPLDHASDANCRVLISTPNEVVDIFDRYQEMVGLSPSQRQSIDNRVIEMTGQAPGELSTSGMLAQREVPTLLFHDKRDREIPFADAEAIVSRNPVEFHATEGHGHRRILRQDSVRNHALTWLRSQL